MKCLICKTEKNLFTYNEKTYCFDCDNEEFEEKCSSCNISNTIKYVKIGKKKYCFKCSEELFF